MAMQDDVVDPICKALTLALGVPVVELRHVETGIQHESFLVLPGRAGEPAMFRVDEGRYLAVRYHSQSTAVLLVGPFREPGDPPSDLVMLGAAEQMRVDVVVRSAARGLGAASDISEQRVELASQLEVSSRSILAITSTLGIDTVLNRIVDLARELSGARYAALGVPGPHGEMESFLTSGMSENQEAQIPHRPRGLGLLGLLLREPQTLRLRNLHEHPASAGFPTQPSADDELPRRPDHVSRGGAGQPLPDREADRRRVH